MCFKFCKTLLSLQCDPDFLVMLFEVVRSKIRGVGRNGTIEAQLSFFKVIEKRFSFYIFFNFQYISYKTQKVTLLL
jgi:hypothetical protein